MDTFQLYLTPAERKQFNALPAALTNDWEADSETGDFEDTEELFRLRLGLLEIKDGALQSLAKQAATLESEADIINFVNEADLESVSAEELRELYFTLGPTRIGGVMAVMLRNATAADHIEAIAALSMIRHALLATAPSY